ncbi:MAG: PBP1A family penicillin-binding protein [Burkholderiales bacterium]|nr:PBP1A family penicillin-binding protein [Burkholderiales bacterium]
MRLIKLVLILLIAFAGVAVLTAAYALLIVVPSLPKLDALVDYRPKIPLRVYTADNVMIGEFGEERRDFVPIKQIPEVMKKALLDTEDERFYRHNGVDYVGVARALVSNIIHFGHGQGASTITMQVARNFFLTREKTYSRKLNEIMLAYRIESELSKDQILELYMNQIYLGERAFGFATAARTYFNKPIHELTIAEAAMLAGLPKAPSTINPVANPKLAKQRQLHVLKRMRTLGHISSEQYAQAAEEKLDVRGYSKRITTHAEYAAEMVRKFMVSQYKEEAYSRGFNVYTTLVKTDQDAAYEAVRRGVLDYDRRHGYRGSEGHINLPDDESERDQLIAETLQKHPDSDELRAAVVLSASNKIVRAQFRSGEEIDINGEGLRFAAGHIARGENGIRKGAVIRVVRDAKKKWTISQLPQVSASLVALNAHDGSFRALVGGFDFALNQFDHVSQAWRQPGSTIKPFIYSAALEKGFAPGSLVNDAPLVIEASDNGAPAWDPQNDNGSYDGPITMRTGLKRSKNLVSIRLLRAITPSYAQDYLTRFGFDAAKHPVNLTLTLGTGSVTPLQMAGAYAVFANGGYHHQPYLIAKVTDARGNVLAQKPEDGSQETFRVIDPRNAFIMDSMMRDVTHSGTAAVAGQRLGRADIAGKTGTTSDAMDGWFAGYGSDVVAVAWMGYDQPQSLGGREFGSTLALPIWIDYMRTALRGKPDTGRPAPAGLVQVDGDWAYQEYADRGTIKSLGVEEASNPGDAIRGLWNRLFGNSPAEQLAPPPGTPRTRNRSTEPNIQSLPG